MAQITGFPPPVPETWTGFLAPNFGQVQLEVDQQLEAPLVSISQINKMLEKIYNKQINSIQLAF